MARRCSGRQIVVRIGFFAGGKLKKIEIAGGPPATLCDAGANGTGTWNPEGIIVFGTAGAALKRVPASGGMPTPASTLEDGENAHTRPYFLPDGRHFLYRVLGRASVAAGAAASQGVRIVANIFVSSLDSTERTPLLSAGSTNVLYAQGHLLFMSESTLMAQPFDPSQLELKGEAFPIVDAVQTQVIGGIPSGIFSVSANGVLAYQSGSTATAPTISWVDRTGKTASALTARGSYADLSLSPDGKRASVTLYDATGGSTDLWLVDLQRDLPTRLTFDSGRDLAGLWSPDGSRIVFSSDRNGHLDLYQKASSGAGDEEVLLADGADKYPLSWSPDGRFLLYGMTGGAGTTNSDLWVLPLGGKPYPFRQTPFTETPAQFSPDGRWVAYTSNESGTNQVYVGPFPGPGGRWQVSVNGGVLPRWRRDGKEMFYWNQTNNRLMAAAVDGRGTAFEIGAVTSLFALRPGGPRSFYDVAADGQRFLVNSSVEQQLTASPITVVVNWTEGIKK